MAGKRYYPLVQVGFEVTKDVILVAKWRDRDTTGSVSFDPPDGTKFFYDKPVTVTLATTEEASIKYKLGEGEWQDYSGPIEILSQNTITAYAIKEGLKDSEKTSATYTVKELTAISITPPTRTVYSVGDTFDSTGMVVTAEYDDGKTRPVEGIIDSDTSSLTETVGVKEITVKYSEGVVEKILTLKVVVIGEATYKFTETPQKLSDYSSSSAPAEGTWTYVQFGDWPQTKKSDDVMVYTEIALTRGGLDFFVGTDGNYYVKHNDSYYKVEPIVWRVLTNNYLVPSEDGTKIESGNALLLAEKILIGGIPYYVNTSSRTIGNATVYPNNYMYSTIRAWLNGLDVVKSDSDSENDSTYKDKGFLQTAFTTSAQNLIEETTVDNSKESTFGRGETGGDNPYVCTNTSDKIFLLSEQEATTAGYGFVEYNEYGEGNTRIRVTTDYAQATGAYQDSTDGYGGWWWLRSPDYLNENYARIIYLDGDANSNSLVDLVEVGVVPALSISMNGN